MKKIIMVDGNNLIFRSYPTKEAFVADILDVFLDNWEDIEKYNAAKKADESK